MNYDVFISYRREGGAAEARLLRQALMARGLGAFLDVTDLRKGYFDEELLRRISATPNFLAVLTPGALDRCDDAEDWMRREIAHAIREKRNIVPVIVGDFEFPPVLPEDLANLPRHQGIHYSHQYFDAMTQSIVDSLDLAASSNATVSAAPPSPTLRGGDTVRTPPAPVTPSMHWSYRVLAGAVLGLVGGMVNALLLSQSVTIDPWGVLLVCGVAPGIVAALAVTRTQGMLPRGAVGVLAGAAAVDVLFLLALMSGGSVEQFNRHLPFWLGPGDERVMMTEAFMLGALLGVAPAIFAALGGTRWHARRPLRSTDMP